MEIKVKKVKDDAILPYKATEGSAGSDLFAAESLVLMPNDRKLVSTGISIELPSSEYGAFIFPRSSLSSKHGISLINCVGVIDSDFRGEIKVALVNHSNMAFRIEKGMRIAQIVIMPVAQCTFSEVNELGNTDRGCGGFGSTGV